ncbi:class I SAM-dependent methyltransferase [Planococcus salinarum]|uniref:class I SAM-dependent methyltransferase n=1 Tax=Planococcus salinarum TaxID=622695 RepID=UPI000E3C2FBA|nr:class I SAM-dependent methyltransferase [Planococcus salinarum]TAA72373.1 class I SAM-dependent methyltransferase [Planococcus salinarum]
MLNKQGFDLWANDYDRTVQLSEENNEYPFAGYKEILKGIFNEAMQTEQSNVLDIGFGTGVLAAKLCENGHHIDGIDFSEEMITIAQQKMPKARLLQADITNGLPEPIASSRYDSIISTYALHHLTDAEKTVFIETLLARLKPGGKIYIGDIAFRTREDLAQCRLDSIKYWDEDEFYFAYDEFERAISHICSSEFHPVSHCGGVIILSKSNTDVS